MHSYMQRKLFTPRYQAEEGLDTSTFFGDQTIVDESTLPDATSDEALAMQPKGKDAAEGDPPADDGNNNLEPPKGNVPLGALQEERSKRQQAQDRQRELETQNNTLMERMNQILLLQQQQQQPKPQEQQVQIPEFLDDPQGHIAALKQQFETQLSEVRQQLSGHNQQAQQQQQYHQLVQNVSVREQEFRSATPDYDAAVAHFQAVKSAEYAAMGLDPVTVKQVMSRDMAGLAQFAFQQNQNPAQVLYNIAKAVGYAPGKGGGGDDGGGNDLTPTAPKTPPTSLSNIPASGRAPDERGRISAKDIATMSNEDFDKLFDGMKGDGVQRPAI